MTERLSIHRQAYLSVVWDNWARLVLFRGSHEACSRFKQMADKQMELDLFTAEKSVVTW